MWKYLRKTFSKKRNQRRAIYIGSALLIAVLALGLFSSISEAQTKQKTLNSKQQLLNTRHQQLDKLNQNLKQVESQKADTQKQLDDKTQAEQQLQQQVQDLNAQLQAKIESKKATVLLASKVTVVTPVAQAVTVAGCGDNSAAQYIYQHESGCNLNAQNSGGCLGIGQACPGSKLTAACPDMSYACQNDFFTSYAVSRYGSWEGAYSAWLSQGWW